VNGCTRSAPSKIVSGAAPRCRTRSRPARFETIRLIARQHELAAPELFAAFMTTAAAAVEGRDAITAAPSLPLAGGQPPRYGEPAPAPGAGPENIADALAGLAAILGSHLGPRRGPASRRRRPGRVPGRGPVSPPDPPADGPRR
jgi:hypothetical protein